MLLSSGNIWCFNSLCISTSTDYCFIQTMFVYTNRILFLSIGLHVFLCLQVSVWDPFSSAPKSFFLKNVFKGFFPKILFIYFRQRGREGEREGNMNVWFLWHTPYWRPNLACSPGMSPDWESNPQPFVSQASAQSTELHLLGPNHSSLISLMEVSC